MKLKLTESQIERLMNEQLTQPKDQTDFSNYIKQFDTIKINNNSFTPDDFLKKLNNSPIQLNLFNIQTDGYNIGTGALSAKGKIGNLDFRLSVKPVGDFKTGMVTITKTI
jgi:hypothetical protein